ncbi:MAG: large subunit ribosomal protein L17 [Candidatus Paceibacteria bacterium]|jgi:large subunit ribosomal protein L17
MRHHNKNRKFGRKRDVRNALMKSLAISLIRHEKIQTTEAKAKSLRPMIEKLITKSLMGTLASRNIVRSRLINQNAETKKLVDDIAPRYKDVNGGYTRITKMPQRLSDGARMAIIEFVK